MLPSLLSASECSNAMCCIVFEVAGEMQVMKLLGSLKIQ